MADGRLRKMLRVWPVRRKLIALLVAAALLPQAVAAMLQVRTARSGLLDATEDLIAARADQLRRQLETMHQAYELTATKISRIPAVLAYRTGPDSIHELFAVNRASDRNLLALAIVDPQGVARIASEPALEGTVPGGEHIASALRGSPDLSDLFVTSEPLESVPAISVAVPIQDAQGTVGAVVLWVRASALWNLVRSAHELGGPGSFAVVTDELGLYVAHSASDALLYRPSGPLAPGIEDRLARESRFGADTARALADVHAFPALHERALADYPDAQLFSSSARDFGKVIGVARRLSTARWTVFYFVPEAAIDAAVSNAAIRELAEAGVITLAVLVIGLLAAGLLLRPVRLLVAATERLGQGDLAVRVPVHGDDELARLAISFNAMAARLAEDDAALRASRDQLESRVTERTSALVEASETEARARSALEASTARMALLARTGHELALASGEVTEVLTLAAARLGEHLGEACAVRLISDDGQWLEPTTAVWDNNPELRARAQLALGAMRVPLAHSLAGHVARTGVPLRVEEFTEARRAEILAMAPAFRPMLEQIGVKSLLVVPVRSRQKPIGVVTLVRLAAKPYTLDDEHFTQEVADRAGLAIDNALLVSTLERRVEERTAALAAANEELEAFSSSVSHDLRAPLRSIDGFSQLLLADYAAQLDEEGQGYLRRVRAATGKMATLIDDLLNLARITRSELRWTEVDLSALAEHVIAELRRREPARTTPVHIQAGLRHRGDARLLAIALENLLGNAWKFTAKHAGAEIWFELHDGAFRVRDSGAGFDMAQADKLFAPFQRLHVASDYEGTGIGLATVKRVVQRHNGQIWAAATPDRGASFSFTLGEAGS